MIKTYTRLLSLLGVGITVSAALLVGFSSTAFAANEKFEWIDESTIKMTYTVPAGGLNSEQTVELKKDGDIYRANNVNGGVYDTNTAENCRYTVEARNVSADKGTANMDSRRTSGNFMTACPNNIVMGDVSLANAEKVGGVSGDGAANGEDEEPTSSCKINGIGWIVCPVVYTLGFISDAAEGMVRGLLKTQPLNVDTANNADNPTYEAWKMMRNIANVAFVIAFLMIIFSQITSFGIGNYGIKKMLPRLIVAAILVNVSYWICALAIDLTNILGASLTTQLDKMTTDFAGDKDMGEFGGGGDKFSTMVGFVLTGGAAVATISFLHLSVLLPLIIGVAATIVTVVVILTVRQALLIVLVVISPLAFVAFLLPNTEGLFNKWKGLFTTLLIMFPAVSLIFGVSAFASKIIMHEGAQDGDILVQMMGAFVAIIPLFVTPIIMKTAGGLLNRIGGIVNNADKGVFDRMRNGAKDYRSAALNRQRGARINRASKILDPDKTNGLGAAGSRRRRATAFLASGGASYAANKEKKRSFEKAATEEGEQAYFAKRAVQETGKRDANGNVIQEGFAERIAGKDMAEGLKASSQAAVNKIQMQDVANRMILWKEDPNAESPGDLLRAALNANNGAGDAVGIQAARKLLQENGSSGYREINEIGQAFARQNGEDNDAINVLKKGIQDDGKDWKAKDPSMLYWAKGRNGYQTLPQAVGQSISGSDAEIASVAPHALLQAAAGGQVTADTARSILSNPQLASSVNDANKETLRAVIASNGQAFGNPNAPVDNLRNTARVLSSSAPTVEDIQVDYSQRMNGSSAPQAGPAPAQPQPQPQPVQQPQPAPQPQPQPQQQSPQAQYTADANMRTSPNVPNTAGWTQTQGGLHVPPTYGTTSTSGGQSSATNNTPPTPPPPPPSNP